MMWTEKYRPSRLNEIIGQKAIVDRLSAFVAAEEAEDMPHFLFAGPPGVGKTTAALALGREILRKTFSHNFLELNASVTGDTPILIRENNQTKRINFQDLADRHFQDDNSERCMVTGLEILSLSEDYTIKFSKVGYLYRHFVDEIADIKYEGGKVKTSLSHSIMVIDDNGNIISKKAAELEEGDLLITFKTEIEGENETVDVSGYKPIKTLKLRSGLIDNPRVTVDLDEIELDEDISWALGLYLAEGCTAFRNGTSGQTIFTIGYPEETPIGERLVTVFERYGISIYQNIDKSGCNRSKESSIQYRVLNTQLAKFVRDSFYDLRADKLDAHTKKVPDFIFNAPIDGKHHFLEGYFDGDGSGDWNKVARFSSVSRDALVDTVWLSRISGWESSHFKTKSRIIWKNEQFNYIKSELLPAMLFEDLARKLKKTKELRHFQYGKRSSRIRKKVAKELLELYDGPIDEKTGNLIKLVNSDISVVKITKIERKKYSDYVYDVSVPGTQTFFGGTMPVLLHNSDERGIATIRERVKEYARLLPTGDAPFRMILLDESDHLTAPAQHAFRRTMESYARCRFVLSCNYSSSIITPIQSRCAIFRFRPIKAEAIEECIRKIAQEEALEIDDSGLQALVDVAEGDLRRLVNALQASTAITSKITDSVVYEVTARARPQEIEELINICLGDRNFLEARKKLRDLLYKHGLSGQDIIKQLYSVSLGASLDEGTKVKLLRKIGEIDARLTQGANSEIQLAALLAEMVSLGA